MSMRQIQDPDDESWVEAEIQRELEELEPLDNDGVYDGIDDEVLDDNIDDDSDVSDDEDNNIPDSVTEYLERVQSRSTGIMKEIEDCSLVLEQVKDKGLSHTKDQPVSKAIEEIAFVIGEDPEDLYDTVMKEIEEEEEKERQDANGNDNDETEMGTFLTAGVVDDKSVSGGLDEDSSVKTDNIEGSQGDQNLTVAVMTESMLAEIQARQKLKQLIQKQKEQDEKREREYRLQKEEIEKQEERIDRMRQEKYREYDEEKVELGKQRKAEEEQLEMEMREESKKMTEMLDEYKANIDEFAKTTEKEREEFEHHVEQQRQDREEKLTTSAIKIQATYRSYRVRKPYLQRLQKMRENRERKREMERQVEILEVRRKEENRKKAEKKKREAAEKKRKEEEERRLKEEEEERVRREEEQRRLEEERQRQEEEARRMEEEMRQKEDEERKRKEEEERIKEEERRKREEEEAERKRQEEEKRKAEEEMKQKEEERKKEEVRRKDEEARRKKQEDGKAGKEKKLIEQLEKERSRDKEKDDLDKKAEDILNKIQNEIQSSQNTVHGKQENISSNNSTKTNRTGTNLDKNKQVENTAEAVSGSAEKGQISVSFEKSDSSVQERTLHGSAIMNTEREDNQSRIMEMLPENLEKRRLEWMEECIPWGKVIGESKSQARKSVKSRIGKRPASAKQLPEISEELLLQASSENASLQQVSTVQVQGLPGCSMSSLKQCPSARSITLIQCGVIAVEGISGCTALQHLNLQHNRIESLNCQDLQKLQELQMSSNCLTNVHGLDGCSDVRVADFSNNRITRTGGFESCHKLTRLLLDHNQLINTRGLHKTPSVQVVDLSHNHLNSVQDLDKCCLLRTLNLTGNSLQEPPKLNNHVLLRQLFLDDNSLGSLEVLSTAWLPLLEFLSVSQNSLSEISPLSNMLLLKKLDVSHNCIADVQSVVSGVRDCHRLQELCVQGNPLTEEQEYRSSIIDKLPWLQKLDSEDVTPRISHDQIRAMSSFEAMCISQIQRQNEVQARHSKQLKETRQRHPGDMIKLLDLKSRQFDEIHDLAVQHRYMHEYGDLTVDSGDSHDGDSENKAPGNSEVMEVPGKPENRNVRFNDNVASQSSVSVSASVVGRGLKIENEDYFCRAAVKIQALWRGYSVRQEIHEHMQRWLAATVIQAYWKGHAVRQEIRKHIPDFYEKEASLRQPYPPQRVAPTQRGMSAQRQATQQSVGSGGNVSWQEVSDTVNGNQMSPLQNMAATKIQALWRGYYIRKRIKEFKESLKIDDEEDDLFGELDLSAFDFNEASLEQGWSPAETPQLPITQHPVLPPTPPVQPHPPRQAWRGANSPMVNDRAQPTPLGKPPLPPGSSMSTETPRTHASSKQEKITEEWGFKDSTTAELMMKRAKKMHRKKKIIDPKKKYELFKKLQDSTKMNHVHPPARKQTNKQDYFQARQHLQNFMEIQSQSSNEQKQQMVFEWVHTQAGPYSGANTPQPLKHPPILGRHTHSDSSLPYIDPQVLEGGRVQLVASPSIELESVGDTSTVVSSPEKNRRHSFSSQNDDKVQFPPLKTNSAPSSHTRDRMAAVERFDGWGGGRRRNKYK